MSTPHLQACPFCGGEAKHVSRNQFAPFIVRCKSCGSESASFYVLSYADEAWNRRANRDELEKVRELLSLMSAPSEFNCAIGELSLRCAATKALEILDRVLNGEKKE